MHVYIGHSIGEAHVDGVETVVINIYKYVHIYINIYMYTFIHIYMYSKRIFNMYIHIYKHMCMI